MRQKFILSLLLHVCFIFIMSFGALQSFFVDIPQADAAATLLQYSDDPNVQPYYSIAQGANTLIGFTDPIGTRFRLCAGTCTGYADSYVNPQQYAGFDWVFENSTNGTVITAEPESGTGNVSCTLAIINGYRYCGVGAPPDTDGDGVPNVIDSCPTEGNIGNFGLTANGCPVDTDGDGLRNFEDTCPNEGNIGNFGLTADGCPVDTDGDGLRNFEDTCPNEGNIGNFGLTADGCPVDTDGDGIKDYQDSCPNLGDERGFGIDSFGCPVDTDEDGMRDYLDYCRNLGDIDGWGIDEYGCPTDTDGDGWDDYLDGCRLEFGGQPNGCPPPPPVPAPSDIDGDKILNDVDECPDVFGTLPNGCPDPNFQCPDGETAVDIETRTLCLDETEDWDGDGISNETDLCPLEKGPLEMMAGCPYPANTCQVAFKDTVVLYSTPNVRPDITVDYNNLPMGVINVVQDGSETWYQVQVNPEYTLYVKDDDRKINFGGGRCGNTIDLESIYQYFEDAGCPIADSSILNRNPETALLDILVVAYNRNESICAIKDQFEGFSNGLPQRYTSSEVILRAFGNSPDVNEFIERVKQCEINLVDFLADLVNEAGGKAVVDALIRSATQDDKDPCEEIRKWRGNQPVELPPDTPIDDQIGVSILVCNTKLTIERYDRLRVNLRDVWQVYIPSLVDEASHNNNDNGGGTQQVRLSELTCRNIESALRLGSPTPDQQLILNKLRECGFKDPIWQLEVAVRKNNDKAEYAQIENCAEFLLALNGDNGELYILPPEFNRCAIGSNRALVVIFFKNYVNVEPPLISIEQLETIKAQINPCKAITDYLAGRDLPPVRGTNPTHPPMQPILTPPIDNTIPPTPSIDSDNDGIVDSIDECPSEYGIQPRGCPSQNTNPPRTALPPLTTQPFSFERLGFFEMEDSMEEPMMIDLYSQVFVEGDTLYLVDLLSDEQQAVVENEPAGAKYAPILFELKQALILSYVLEVDGVFYIRIINLDVESANITLAMPEGIFVDRETRIAFNEEFFVFDATDTNSNNQRNIYWLNMIGTQIIGDQTPQLFISNAQDPAPVEGEYQTFIFVSPNNENGTIFRYTGLRDGLAYTDSDDGFGKSCKRPLAEEYDYDMQYWFLCEVGGDWRLFVNSNASQYRESREPNSVVSSLDISFQNITLGLDTNSLYIDNNNEIHQFLGVDNLRFVQNGHSMFTLR